MAYNPRYLRRISFELFFGYLWPLSCIQDLPSNLMSTKDAILIIPLRNGELFVGLMYGV